MGVVFTIPNNGTAMLEFLTTADGVEFVTGYWHIKNLIIEVREAWQEKDEPIDTFKSLFCCMSILSNISCNPSLKISLSAGVLTCSVIILYMGYVCRFAKADSDILTFNVWSSP